MRPATPFACNHSREDIVTAMNAAPTKEEYIRIHAIYMLLTGIQKNAVTQSLAINTRTLNRWIHRYNLAGIDGLIDRPRSGRPLIIKEDTEQKIISLLNNPEQANVFHWTIRHLHGFLKEEIDLNCSYQTLIRTIHKKNFVLRVPRPQPTKQDEIARALFQERLCKWKEDNALEIWFIDETGIE
jgi:transposase